MILVTGEALIDMLPREVAGDRYLRPVPGGSPFNVALALGRLGVPVHFLCRFSSDAFGEQLRRHLAASAVNLDWCPRTEALSTLGFVTLDEAAKTARYAFYTAGTAGCSLDCADLPVPLPDGIAAIHVGSFSLAVEPFGSAVEELVNYHAGLRFIAFDPNIRPFLIPDRECFLARYHRLAARAHLLKLSLEDLEWLHPGATPEQAASDYLGRGLGMVVITGGADGAVAWNHHGNASVRLPQVQVVDTVGAGDTFQAALLAWLWRQGQLHSAAVAGMGLDDMRDLISFASTAAAINCTRAGCDPPWLEEVSLFKRAPAL